MATHGELTERARKLLDEEIGTLFKQAPLRVGLCKPSPYHVGMSSLGFQTLYRLIHAQAGATAERAFLPDDVEEYRRARSPVFTLESQTPLGELPVIAFSVAYELELQGLLDVLDLSGIPPERELRTGAHPLIVAGGPLTFSNPEPLEPFVDLLVQGEAEDLLPQLLEVLSTGNREEALAELARRPGFRVPALDAGPSLFVAKASDRWLPACSQIITPNTELRSMFLIEPERGCSRGCHYCVMRRTTNGGMRQVAPERVLSLIPNEARKVGLVGAAVTDHPRIVPLLREIVDSGRGVGVSSLRADRLTPELVQALRDGGSRVLTVASDGPSQRMRELVDRKHSEAQIVRAAELARASGIERLKVYTIIGLPLEEDEDIDELVRFTRELSHILPVALGVSPFVAKRHTPLDGAPFAGISLVERRIKQLKRGLKGRAEVRPSSARWAWVEHMLAQAGPEAGLAARDAWRAGGRFADWKRAFDERDVRLSVRNRVPDGRTRNATVWPTLVDPRSAASARGEGAVPLVRQAGGQATNVSSREATAKL